MGRIDDFLRQHVAGGLEPGETVMGMGLLRHPTRFNILLVPERYDEYLGVATDRRLIVFETETGMSLVSPNVKPVARNPIEWRYDELHTAAMKQVEGLVVHSGGAATALMLTPHPFCGPFASQQEPHAATGKGRRYDIYAAIDGIDGQGAMWREYPPWLTQRVTAGAFPMSPERRAAVEARIAEQRAKAAAEQARRLQAAAERDAKMKATWQAFKPYLPATIVGLVALGAAGTSTAFIDEGWRHYSRGSDETERYEPEVAMLKKDLATWVRDPKLLPPDDCPEDKWAYLVGERRDREGQRKCHACSVTDAKPFQEPKEGARVFQRGPKWWFCHGPSIYEIDLSHAQSKLESAEDDVSGGMIELVVAGVAGLLGLAGIPVAIFLGLRARRRTRAATAPPAPHG
jgi:hypothetical protein